MGYGIPKKESPKRVMFYPVLGMTDAVRDSNFLLSYDYWKYLDNLYGCYAYFVVRKQDVDRVKEYCGTDRCKVLGLEDTYFDYWTDASVFNGRQIMRWFNRGIGDYGFVDYCFTGKEGTLPLQLALSRGGIPRYVPIIKFEPQVYFKMFDKQPWHIAAYAGDVFVLQIVLNRADYEARAKEARRILSPTFAEKFVDNMAVLGVGVPIEKIQPIIKDVKKNDEFTLFFGGRVTGTKDPRKVFDLFNYFFESGRKAKIVLSTGSDKGRVNEFLKNHMLKNSIIEPNIKVGREDFWKLSAQSHVYSVFSTEEGFPVGFWETLYCGSVGMFPKIPWATSQIPEWYPFFHKDLKEAYKMTVPKIRKHVEENYTSEIIWSRVTDLAYEKFDRQLTWRMGERAGRLLQEITHDLGNNFTLMDVLKELERRADRFLSNKLIRMQTSKYPADYDVKKYIESLGYRDTLLTDQPSFVKEK